MFTLLRIRQQHAFDFIDALHRHHKAPQGAVFYLAATKGETIVGVAVVGRPVARGFDPDAVAEVTRLCTDGTPNACSFLYGAAARAATALGFQKIITYTLASEPGTSLRASGWVEDERVHGRRWSCPSRPRTTAELGPKIRWAKAFRAAAPAAPDLPSSGAEG
jgi:hypothetical protein